jgi:hypothetical protein
MPFQSILMCNYGSYSSDTIAVSCNNTHQQHFFSFNDFKVNTLAKAITGFQTTVIESQPTLVIPTSINNVAIERISDGAFQSSSELGTTTKQLIFNYNAPLNTINANAFAGNSLESIYFSQSLDYIGNNAFAQNTALNTLEFTRMTPPSFEATSFANDTAISTIYIPHGSINNYATPSVMNALNINDPSIFHERAA